MLPRQVAIAVCRGGSGGAWPRSPASGGVAPCYRVRRVRRRCYLLQIVVSLVLLDLALPQYWLRHLTSTSTGDAASYDRDFCRFR
jgi:hypothetical protein